jgi:NAD(P)-dependent dehydrogenase (short-subunit alcohol dehydrogenase family)
MTTDHSYRNKVAIITGGASGIGAALAEHLARQGARVVIADRQVDLAESIAAAIRASGGTADAFQLDVRELASMQRVVSETVARWGAIDYFFNNAGIGLGGEAADYTHDDWNDVVDVNLRGVIHGIEAVYPVMIRQQSGHIINTASVAGLVVTTGQAGYAATKHAVYGLSKALRLEGRQHGVKVTVLCPGAIRTPILQGGKYGRFRMNDAARRLVDESWEWMRPMAPAELAVKVAQAVARNEAIIVQPSWWRLLWALERLSPAITLKLAELAHVQMQKRLPPRPSDSKAEPPPSTARQRAQNLS